MKLFYFVRGFYRAMAWVAKDVWREFVEMGAAKK